MIHDLIINQFQTIEIDFPGKHNNVLLTLFKNNIFFLNCNSYVQNALNVIFIK